MKKTKLVSYILVIIVLFSYVTILNTSKVYAASNGCVTVTTTGTYNYTMAQEVLTLVNQKRSEAGLGSLTLDTNLLNIAMLRAAETSIYWSHTRPNGTTCFTISSKMDAENIAALQTTASEVMNSWMNSSGHKANIMSNSYKSIGIGCYYSNYKYYWVQVFSKSSSSSTSTKTGKQEVTNKIDVSNNSIYLNVKIKGLESTKTLDVGDTYAATSAALANQTLGGTSYILLTDLTWKSSNTEVCTVNESGKITAVGSGKAIITATLGNSVTSYTITVNSGASVSSRSESTGTSSTISSRTENQETSTSSRIENTETSSTNIESNVTSMNINNNTANNSDSSNNNTENITEENIDENTTTNNLENETENITNTETEDENDNNNETKLETNSESNNTENTSSVLDAGDTIIENLIAAMVVSGIEIIAIIIKIRKVK